MLLSLCHEKGTELELYRSWWMGRKVNERIWVKNPKIPVRGDLVEYIRILIFLMSSMGILAGKPMSYQRKGDYNFFLKNLNRITIFLFFPNVFVPNNWQTQVDGQQLLYTQRHTHFDIHTFVNLYLWVSLNPWPFQSSLFCFSIWDSYFDMCLATL